VLFFNGRNLIAKKERNKTRAKFFSLKEFSMLFRRRFEALSSQSDEALLSSFSRVLGRENKRKAEFLIYLSAIDARRLYAKQGFSSFFAFLTEKYGFSESSALKRIQASRLTHRYPFLFDEIASGKRTLSALSRIAPFVKDANAPLLFQETLGKSVRDVERLLAKRFPEAATPDRLQKTVRPISEDQVHVSFTADLAFEKDLLEAKALLSHRFPQGKLSDVLGVALKSLLKDLKKQASKSKKSKAETTTTTNTTAPSSIPRGMQTKASKVPKPSRHIPRGVRATIWERDQARCRYPKPEGGICGETHFLEIDHCWLFAWGGKHEEGNLRLLCRTHNQLMAEKFFGRRFDPFAGREGVPSGQVTPP
jgi:5-methylcytosine-specific restriction endonuclease McrA